MKKKGTKSGIIVAILLLAVGFAAVTTTLIITGTIKIVPDTQDFIDNVIFNSEEVDATSEAAGTTAEISTDGKTLTITTHELKTIGETVTVTYDVANNSQYDAQFDALSCEITNETNDVEIENYITVTPGKVLEKYTTVDPLASGNVSDKDTLTIQMVRSYAGTADDNDPVSIKLECNLVANAVESTTSASADPEPDAGE